MFVDEGSAGGIDRGIGVRQRSFSLIASQSFVVCKQMSELLTLIVCLTLSDRFDAELADAKERCDTRELVDAARFANWRRDTSLKAMVATLELDETN